jgi:DNA polymerase III delta prime subunit
MYEYDLHKDVMMKFHKLIESDDMTNQLLYGVTGCGKKCIIRTVIREKLNVYDTKFELKTYVANNDNKSEITFLCIESTKHIEIILNNYGTIDKYLINGYLKEKIDTMTFSGNGALTYKIIVLYNIHNLTKTSQHILKELIESYSKSSRFIMTTDKYGYIIKEIKSRSNLFRVPCVSENELYLHVKKILDEKEVTMTKPKIMRIIRQNDTHIQNSIDNIQCEIMNGSNKRNIFDSAVDTIVECICKGKPFRKIRDEIYILIVNNATGCSILKMILLHILDRCNDKPKLCMIAAKYEHNIVTGERAIYHIESFIQTIIYECTFVKNKTNSKSLLSKKE